MACATRFPMISKIELLRMGLPIEPNHDRRIVLVVESERNLADTRTAILCGWGYTVLTAYDAESALELARETPPEILVSNLQLQRGNSLTLVNEIRSLAPACKVLLISGINESNDLRLEVQRQGLELSLVTRPVHPAQLFSLLDSL